MYFIIFFTDNLSHNKIADQSHTSVGPAFDAKQAIDQKTDTCMRTEQIGGSSPHKTVWWKVDLGNVYSIYSINILFKDYDTFGIYATVLK